MDKSILVTAGIIISIAAVCVVIYFGYQYLLRKQQEEPIFVRKPRNAKKPGRFSGSEVPLPSDGFGYTAMMWLNINDIDYRRNKWKHIFNKGTQNAFEPQPGMWIKPKDNELVIRYTTLGDSGNYKITEDRMFVSVTDDDYLKSYYIIENNKKLKDLYRIASNNGNHGFVFASKEKPTNDDFIVQRAMIKTQVIGNDKIMDSTKYENMPKEYRMYLASFKGGASMNPEFKNSVLIDDAVSSHIKNIPLNRWFHIAIVVNAQSADVYIDGKLRASTGLKDFIKQNSGDLFITQRGGFGGMLTQLRYYGKPLEISTIQWIYSFGPDPITLPDLKGPKLPKIPKVKLECPDLNKLSPGQLLDKMGDLAEGATGQLGNLAAGATGQLGNLATGASDLINQINKKKKKKKLKKKKRKRN